MCVCVCTRTHTHTHTVAVAHAAPPRRFAEHTTPSGRRTCVCNRFRNRTPTWQETRRVMRNANTQQRQARRLGGQPACRSTVMGRRVVVSRGVAQGGARHVRQGGHKLDQQVLRPQYRGRAWRARRSLRAHVDHAHPHRRLLPARTALYAPSTSLSLGLFPCCWWSIFAREVPRTPDAHACAGRRTEFFPYGHGTVDDNARSGNATCVANASTNWREWNVTVSCAIWLCSRVLTRDNNAQAPRLHPCLFGPLGS